MQGKNYCRLLKVYPFYMRRQFLEDQFASQIKLTGQWLTDAGFLPNTPIQVHVQENKLVITPIAEKEVSNV